MHSIEFLSAFPWETSPFWRGNQWRREDFSVGGGGRPGHLKAITRPPRGVRGAGSEVAFLRRCKVLENESIFQKYEYIFLPKIHFFLRKIPKIEIF